MKVYRVSSTMVVSVSVLVRAKDPAEAKEKATDRQTGGLCYSCSREGSEWRASELDGEPDFDSMRVEETDADDFDDSEGE